jgi:hypothetical protein
LSIKEQEKRLTLNEHDDDDEDIKMAPTCFSAVTPLSGSALFGLAKVTVVKIAN